MKISDVIPTVPPRLYCTNCGTASLLTFKRFHKTVGGIKFDISSLPTLICPRCDHENLPDRTRAVICRLHFDAESRLEKSVQISRKKSNTRFEFAKSVEFDYDSDDYYYIPGLIREGSDGYLTPVFFRKYALLKFTTWPGYSLRMCSKSYGTIWKGDNYAIPFGINSSGLVIMWLGDLDRLPPEELHYLRSENVASDHDIGSEFYDGQIEAIFTPQKPEDQFFHAWLRLMTAIEVRHGLAVDSLREESLNALDELVPPLTGQDKEILQKCDAFNKVTLETLSKPSLIRLVKRANLAKENKVKLEDLGTLKLLQALLGGTKNVERLLCPLFVLYDLRVLESHRHGTASYGTKIESAATRLGLLADAKLDTIYCSLLESGTSALIELAVEVETSSVDAVP